MPQTPPRLADEDYRLNFPGPTAYEQLMVELINRGRQDPNAEVSRLVAQGESGVGLASGVNGTPKQVLAVVPALDRAAQRHSDDMIRDNFFDHTNPNTGDNPADRAEDAGYGSRFVGENIGAIFHFNNPFTSARIEDHHANLWESDGHQRNILSGNYSEIGVGYATGSYRYQGTTFPESSIITQKYGDRGHVYVTGVVIDDTDNDAFYDIGEGQGDVRITAWNADGVFATSTWDSGGYSLRLEPGTYTIHFEGGDLDGFYQTQVTVGDNNVKLDVIEDRDAQPGEPVDQPDPADPPDPIDPPGPGDQVLRGNSAANEILGDDGDDDIAGRGGNDTLGGRAGNDVIHGDSGNDKVRGGWGNDELHGGSGNDLVSGNRDDDMLYGDAGRDLIRGGSGNDQLYGGADRDRLLAGDGDDTLDGGTGFDLLAGGRGADRFIFSEGYDRDRIANFEDDVDTLVLDDSLWSGNLSAQQVVNRFGEITDKGAVLDFGGGDTLTIRNVTDLQTTVDDILIA